MEKQTGNKTRVTIEEGCLRSYPSIFCSSNRWIGSVGRLKNDDQWSWYWQQFCYKAYTNSSPKESPRLQLTILAFCLIFRPYFGEYYPRKRWHHSDKVSLQIHMLSIDNSFWVYSICQYLGQPGLTNIKLHWYDLNHQLHLQINTLVLESFLFGILKKSRLFALALFTFNT